MFRRPWPLALIFVRARFRRVRHSVPASAALAQPTPRSSRGVYFRAYLRSGLNWVKLRLSLRLSLRDYSLMFYRALPFCSVLLLLSGFPFSTPAQQPPPKSPPSPPAVSPAPSLDYPDSTSGLEHLVRDIIQAQQENEGARASALLRSFILPNPHEWYEQIFGGNVAAAPESLYEKAAAFLPPQLAEFFLASQTSGMKDIRAVRLENSCDDNAGEDAFGVLHARLQPVPFYELRLIRGDQLARLFPFAFVNGAFRFILAPKMEGNVFGHAQAKTASTAADPTASARDSIEPRLRVGGAAQAAKLVKRVQPHYPETARREHLQGTVKLHALVGKDGSLRQVYVVKGYCSLAESSLDAVRQWRYSPTILNGKPVEVDTEIDVVFSLSP